MSRGAWEAVETLARRIVDDLQTGRAARVDGRLDPDVLVRVRQILSGDERPPFENTDD